MRELKYSCPISGSELTFPDHAMIFNKHIQGSNCYSYAMNHPKINGQRMFKSVPGDISKQLANKIHESTDWQSCGNAIERIEDDANTMRMVNKIGGPILKRIKGNIQQQMKTKPPNNWRKILLVVDTNDEPKGVPTDFHFYAQNKMLLGKIYNIERVGSPCCNKQIKKNIYNILKLDAFSGKNEIQRRMLNKNGENARMYKKLLENRDIINIELHVNLMPDYALDFIIDGWWMLDIPYYKRNRTNLNKAVRFAIKKVINGKYEKEKKMKMIKTIKSAQKECEKNIRGIPMYNKNRAIGLWSHKLGWGTEPLNTDGNGKIILNPVKCSRYHGGYDYDKACQAFFVLRGHGYSSV